MVETYQQFRDRLARIVASHPTLCFAGKVTETCLELPHQYLLSCALSVTRTDHRFHLNKSVYDYLDSQKPVSDIHTSDYLTKPPLTAVKIRIYKASKNAGQTVVFFHGGCFVAGSCYTHDNACRLMAEAWGVDLYSVDYPLAPEHEAGEIITLCYNAVVQISAELIGHRQADCDGGGKRCQSQVALWLVGDSAGTSILNSILYLLCATDSAIDIAKVILVNPIVDLLDSFQYRHFCSQYLGGRIYPHSPLVYPLVNHQIAIPDTYMILSAEDVLYDQGKNYRDKLRQWGANVHAKTFPGGHLGATFATGTDPAREVIGWLCQAMEHNGHL